jgi:predicted enzyme related to lactoylglutathione lyase
VGETDVVNSHGHFAWYELITTDVEAATAFYTKVMGWGALDASVPGRTYILLTAGQAPVSGLMDLPEGERDTGGQPCWVGYVRVDDVDATAGRIKRLGGAVLIPPNDIPDICRFSIFSDPQAATLALLKSLSPAPEQPAGMGAAGRVAWHELHAADGEKAFAFYGELFGWQKANADIRATGTYQQFSAGGQPIGGMLTKPPMAPVPFWLYYFNIGDIDAAAKRVMAGGGQILDGPLELLGGAWIVQCMDPQGAMFALKGTRSRNPVGYFERAASRDPSDARGTRWHW